MFLSRNTIHRNNEYGPTQMNIYYITPYDQASVQINEHLQYRLNLMCYDHNILKSLLNLYY